MKKINWIYRLGLVLLTIQMPWVAQAVDEAGVEGAENETNVSVNVAEEPDEAPSRTFIAPTAGLISYEGSEDFAAGLMFDANFSGSPAFKIGPSIGIIYSALDQAVISGDTFDADSRYILQFPANVKVSWMPGRSDRIGIGAHGGANILYTSPAADRETEFGGNTDSDARVAAFPNVGGDVDFRLGDSATLALRPDVSFLDTFNMYTVTLGLGILL